MSELNASAVKEMKVTDLRSELTKRGLDMKGLKQVLVDRLLAAAEDDQVDEMATEAKEEAELTTKETADAVKNGEKENIESRETIGVIEPELAEEIQSLEQLSKSDDEILHKETNNAISEALSSTKAWNNVISET